MGYKDYYSLVRVRDLLTLGLVTWTILRKGLGTRQRMWQGQMTNCRFRFESTTLLLSSLRPELTRSPSYFYIFQISKTWRASRLFMLKQECEEDKPYAMKRNSDLKLTWDFLQENWKWIVAKLPAADGNGFDGERRQTRGLNKYLPNSHVSAVFCTVPRPPQPQAWRSWQPPEVIHPPWLGVRTSLSLFYMEENITGENWRMKFKTTLEISLKCS